MAKKTKRSAPYSPAAKKRNPQDATLRNIRALKAAVARLTERVEALESAQTPAAPAFSTLDVTTP